MLNVFKKGQLLIIFMFVYVISTNKSVMFCDYRK